MTRTLPRLTVADLAAKGRELPEAFELALVTTTPAEAERGRASGSTSLLECESVLRLLPGRRLVARVRVDGAERVLKLFFGGGAGRYFRRERRGCEALRATGVATPALAGAVCGDAGARGLLFDWIGDARPLDPFDQGGLEAAAAELARLHAGGWRHADLHLDNFLVAPGLGRPHLIDGDGVRPADVLRPAAAARRRRARRHLAGLRRGARLAGTRRPVGSGPDRGARAPAAAAVEAVSRQESAGLQRVPGRAELAALPAGGPVPLER